MNIKKTLLVLVLLGTGFTELPANASPLDLAQNLAPQTTDFSVSYFDNSGQPVGSGAFSYANEGTHCIELVPINTCSRNPPGWDNITVTHYLNGFSGNLLGQSLYLGAESWWADTATSQLPGYVARERSGRGFITYNLLFLGDPFSGYPYQMSMGISSVSDTAADGTWFMSIASSNFGLTTGTWTARSTPDPISIPTPETEPLAGLASFAALGFATILKRKLAQNATNQKNT